jgi:hypothetical protein
MSGDINMEDTFEQIWNKVKVNILESAEKVLGHQPRNHNRQWFAFKGEQCYRK